MLVFSAGGCKKPAPPEKAADARVHVETAVVSEALVPRMLALDGTLRGAKETELAANAAGRVLETFVDRGSEVKKGDVLVKLDVRSAASAAAEANANVAIANAVAAAADRDCARYKALLDSKAIGQAEYDRTADQCRTGPLSRQAAEARAAGAAQAVLDGTVRAPFDGVVGQRDVEIGEYVRPDSRIATLFQLDPLRLEMTVPESVAPAVKMGASVTFVVAGYPDRTFEGTVRYVAPAVREATRDVVMDADVPNLDRTLKPGMFADVRVESGTWKQPMLPSNAIVDPDGHPTVFAVVDERLEARIVQLGAKKGDLVVCLRGCTVGDVVVDHPAADLFNGEGVE